MVTTASIKDLRASVTYDALLRAFDKKFENGLRNDWATICEHVNQWAKSKGWRSQPRGVMELYHNLMGELAEMWEEFRKSRLDLYFTTKAGEIVGGDQLVLVESQPENFKPEGFWVELADLVIRCADAVTEFDLPMHLHGEFLTDDLREFSSGEVSLMGGLTKLSRHVGLLAPVVLTETTTFATMPALRHTPRAIVRNAFIFAEVFNVDLLQLLQIKMRYNHTRPVRHGNKLA